MVRLLSLLMSSAGKKRSSEVLKADPGDPESSNSQDEAKKSSKKHKPLPESKFGGMTEEEVCKLLLPDHMKPGLDIIFVREQT